MSVSRVPAHYTRRVAPFFPDAVSVLTKLAEAVSFVWIQKKSTRSRGFGRVAGKHAAEAVLGANVKAANLRHLSAETTKQAIERRWASRTRWSYSRPTRRMAARRKPDLAKVIYGNSGADVD